MSDEKDATYIHAWSADKSLVYVSWREDCWQPGDPMFDSVHDRGQVHGDQNERTVVLVFNDTLKGRSRKSQAQLENPPSLTIAGEFVRQK